MERNPVKAGLERKHAKGAGESLSTVERGLFKACACKARMCLFLEWGEMEVRGRQGRIQEDSEGPRSHLRTLLEDNVARPL